MATTKKAAAKTEVKVKVIQTIDSVLGKDTTVYFTDGTHAVIKSGSNLFNLLTDPENVAPNIVKVTMRGGTISGIKRVEVDNPDD